MLYNEVNKVYKLHAQLLQLCPTLCDPMTIACQASLSTGFSKQEYWNGLPYPPPGGLLHPGIKPVSLMSPALADRFPTTSATVVLVIYCCVTW